MPIFMYENRVYFTKEKANAAQSSAEENPHAGEGKLKRDAEKRIAHQWARHFADSGEEHSPVDHVVEAAKDGVGHTETFGFIAFDEPVSKREAAHAAVPYGTDPVNGRNEKPVHDAPHATYSVGDGATCSVHGIGRTGARPERGKGLE